MEEGRKEKMKRGWKGAGTGEKRGEWKSIGEMDM